MFLYVSNSSKSYFAQQLVFFKMQEKNAALNAIQK